MPITTTRTGERGLFGRRSPGKHSHAYVVPPAHAAPVSAPAIEPRALDGHALAMVRPYLVAHERRQERQRDPQRTRTLMLASVGVDFLSEVPR